MARPRVHGLTQQQQHVLDLMAHRRTNFEIAQDLGISLDGAKYHIRQVFDKLGVDSREEAIAAWQESRGSLFERIRGFLWPVGALAAGGVAVVVAIVVVVLALSGSSKTPAGAVGSRSSVPAGVWVAEIVSLQQPQGSPLSGTLEVFKAGDEKDRHVFQGFVALVNDNSLRWSPDGKHLAVENIAADRSIALRIWSRNGATWTSTTVAAIENPGQFDWSPNSQALVLLNYHDGRPQIMLVDTSGKTLSSVDIPADRFDPSSGVRWSPDGKLAAWPVNGTVVVLTSSGAHIDKGEGSPEGLAQKLTGSTPAPSADDRPTAGPGVAAALPEPDGVKFVNQGPTADGSAWVFSPIGGPFDVGHLMVNYTVAVQTGNGAVRTVNLGSSYPGPSTVIDLDTFYAVVVVK